MKLLTYIDVASNSVASAATMSLRGLQLHEPVLLLDASISQ